MFLCPELKIVGKCCSNIFLKTFNIMGEFLKDFSKYTKHAK